MLRMNVLTFLLVVGTLLVACDGQAPRPQPVSLFFVPHFLIPLSTFLPLLAQRLFLNFLRSVLCPLASFTDVNSRH